MSPTTSANVPIPPARDRSRCTSSDRSRITRCSVRSNVFPPPAPLTNPNDTSYHPSKGLLRRLTSALFTLWTVLALLGAHASPAFAFAQVAGRAGVESAAASPTGDHEAISAGTSRRTSDARKLERTPRTSHHAPPAATWASPVATHPGALAADLAGVLPPLSWTGWETASRARARLMTFLN